MRNPFRAKTPPVSAPQGDPPSVGERRVYAIGDIHGRDDLFADLLLQIDADSAARGAIPTELILLGDLVDRGPSSAQVVERALALSHSDAPVRFLKGNHEEVFLLAARGDVRALRFFYRIGGRATILSYGLSASDYLAMDDTQLRDWMLNHVPRAHLDFIEDFEDMIAVGDYLFVHAGIRPDVALDAQDSSDLRWIREEFLRHPGAHSHIVVHGHTIFEEVDARTNRIGIDTGAFASGKLTAIGLEGTKQWFLATDGAPCAWADMD